MFHLSLKEISRCTAIMPTRFSTDHPSIRGLIYIYISIKSKKDVAWDIEVITQMDKLHSIGLAPGNNYLCKKVKEVFYSSENCLADHNVFLL